MFFSVLGVVAPTSAALFCLDVDRASVRLVSKETLLFLSALIFSSNLCLVRDSGRGADPGPSRPVGDGGSVRDRKGYTVQQRRRPSLPYNGPSGEIFTFSF